MPGSPCEWRSIVALGIALLAACTSDVPDGALTKGAGRSGGGESADGSTLDVQFLSTSAFLISSGEDALLTDPFFSNPTLRQVLSPGCLAPDAPRIDALMPPRERTARARAVLIGQGHYDHLMDVPYVIPRYAPAALVHGSRTAGFLLAPFGVRSVDVNEHMGSREHMGHWLPVEGTAMRVMPLVSEHAPQILGMHLVTGTLDAPPEHTPCASWDWLQGDAVAFVIDWLDASGAVRFRVHFQDSATNAPFAFHPRELLDDGVPVDVALLPVASFANVERYPEALIEHLAPRHVVLHHWDDFFVDPRADPVVLRGQDLPAFLARLEAVLPEGADWAMPARGVTLSFGARHRLRSRERAD